MKKTIPFNFFRTIALIVLLLGAAGSIYFVINAGRNNNSVVLKALFVIWVLSPFIAFATINTISARWPLLTQITIYWLMLLVAIGSLVCYSGVFKTPGTKPAFIFLIVPLLSWLLIIIATLVTQRLSPKNK